MDEEYGLATELAALTKRDVKDVLSVAADVARTKPTTLLAVLKQWLYVVAQGGDLPNE